MTSARMRRGSIPPWGLFLGAALAAGVLILKGYMVLSGLLGMIVLTFAIALVVLMVWGLIGLARPGTHVAVEGPLPFLRDSLGGLGRGGDRVRRGIGWAPWRSPQTIVNVVAKQVTREIAHLPEGDVAVPTVEVLLNEGSIERLDRWMPIENAAQYWARAYAKEHATTARASTKVTVLVLADSTVALNRARVRSTFRETADLDHTNVAAFARAPLSGPLATPYPDGGPHTVHRAPHKGSQPPSDATPHPRVVSPTRHLGPHDPDATQAMDPDATHLLDPDATRLVDHDRTDPMGCEETVCADSGADRHSTDRAGTGISLLPVNPVTGKPTRQPAVPVRPPGGSIGRSADNPVRLHGSHVSRHHAELRWTTTGWIVMDLDSTTGTRVNGRALRPRSPHPLAAGDVVEVGHPEAGGPRTAFQIAPGPTVTGAVRSAGPQ